MMNERFVCKKQYSITSHLGVVYTFSKLRLCNKHIIRTWNDVQCPTKWRGSSLRQTLQVRVTSDTQKIQLKWRCTLWGSVNFHIFVGHQMSFQAVCRYVNWIMSILVIHFASWLYLYCMYMYSNYYDIFEMVAVYQ